MTLLKNIQMEKNHI